MPSLYTESSVGTVIGNRNEGGNGRLLHWVVLVDWTLEGASAPQGLILASMKGSLEAIWQCKLLPHMGPVAGRVRSPHVIPCHFKLSYAKRGGHLISL